MIVNKLICDFCGSERDVLTSNGSGALKNEAWNSSDTPDSKWRTIRPVEFLRCEEEHMCPDCYNMLKELKK